MKNIVLLGAPASGKGTISNLLTKMYNIPHISTGKILNDITNGNDEKAKVIKKYINSGVLVPDDMIIKIVKERLEKDDCKNGYILDGFPRTVEQAKKMHILTNNSNLKANFIINIFVEGEILKNRMFYRQICERCGLSYNSMYNKPKIIDICDVCHGRLIKRSDDNQKTFSRRLSIYEGNLTKIIKFYEENNYLFINIDGNMNIEDIIHNIKIIIDGSNDE